MRLRSAAPKGTQKTEPPPEKATLDLSKVPLAGLMSELKKLGWEMLPAGTFAASIGELQARLDELEAEVAAVEALAAAKVGAAEAVAAPDTVKLKQAVELAFDSLNRAREAERQAQAEQQMSSQLAQLVVDEITGEDMSGGA